MTRLWYDFIRLYKQQLAQKHLVYTSLCWKDKLLIDKYLCCGQHFFRDQRGGCVFWIWANFFFLFFPSPRSPSSMMWMHRLGDLLAWSAHERGRAGRGVGLGAAVANVPPVQQSREEKTIYGRRNYFNILFERNRIRRSVSDVRDNLRSVQSGRSARFLNSMQTK